MSAGSDPDLSQAGIWKAWTLLCVGEASRLGVVPLAMAQLHVLLYLANTLCPLYDVERVRGRVLKRGAYPFYPDVQRLVDKLAFSGVLAIDHVKFGPKGHLAAHYTLLADGAGLRDLLISSSFEAQRTAHLFRELTSACFGKFLGTETAIGPVDANYGSSDILENEVIDFDEWQANNKNLAVAKYLIEQLRAMQPRAHRDGIRLYCEYLDKAMEVAL